MSVRVPSDESESVILGDVVVHPLQLHDPNLAYVYEVDAAVAARTRLSLLEELAAEEVVVAAGHLPRGLGRVLRDGNAFGWGELRETEGRRSTLPGRLRPDQDECVQDA